jgi:hypothetical protein
MRVRWIEVPLFLLLLVTAACGRPSDSAGSLAMRATTGTSVPPAQAALTLASQRQYNEGARRIRTATLAVEVSDQGASEKAISSAVEDLGGFVQDSHASGEGTDRTISYVIRVPAERFDDAVASLEDLGKVLESSSQTEDVTEAYADLEMRIRVKKGVEARLRTILDERAGKLSEVLEVENQLARVVEEVERLETAMRGYDRQIAWSTVKLELRQAPPIVQAGFLASVSAAFHDGVATFTRAGSALVYLLTFLAPWILAGAVLLWAVGRVRRRTMA